MLVYTKFNIYKLNAHSASTEDFKHFLFSIFQIFFLKNLEKNRKKDTNFFASGLLQQINFPRAILMGFVSKYSQNIGEAKNGGTLKFSDFFEIQKMPNFSDFFKILTKFFKNLANFTNFLNPHFWPHNRNLQISDPQKNTKFSRKLTFNRLNAPHSMR